MSQIQRKSNFEVLRIVALLLIIFFHMSDHGGVPFGSGTLFDDVYFQLLAFGGRVGVWIFVMISGYFLVNKTFKFRKMVKLMGECLFYNILVVLFIFLFGIRVLNHHEIIQACLPFGTYNWFASCYIVFYMFFPFVNVFLHKISRQQHLLFLLIGLVVWFLIPTFANTVTLWIPTWGSQIVIFTYAYSFWAYIRFYYADRLISPKYLAKCFFSLLGTYLIIGCSIYCLSKSFHFLNQDPLYLSYDSIFTILFSMILFLLFKNIHMNHHHLINLVAKTTFGIYLLHDNELINEYLWQNILHIPAVYGSTYMVLKTLSIGVAIFIVGMVIDLIRIKLLEEPIFDWINPKLDEVQMKMERWYDSLTARLIN